MFFLLLLFFSFCYCDDSFDVFGFRVEHDLQLISINPQTMDYTDIGKQYPDLEGCELSSIDAKNNLYYLITYDQDSKDVYLSAFDLKYGDRKYHILTPFKDSFIIGGGQACDVDPISGDVYIVGRVPDQDDPVKGKHHLLRITPSTGNIDDIASFGYVDFINAPSAFMFDKGLLFLNYYDNSTSPGEYFVIVYNIKDGSVFHHFTNTPNMQTMTYDIQRKLVFGIGLKDFPVDPKRTLISVDENGNFNEVGVIDGYMCTMIDQGTLDPKRGVYYAIMQKAPYKDISEPFYIVTIDLDTAKVTYTSNLCFIHDNYGTPVCPFSMNHRDNLK